jgi:hypothetical protein
MAMNYHELGNRIGHCFSAIEGMLDFQVQTLTAMHGGYSCTFHFEIDVETVRRLGESLSRNSRLWCDFQRAIQAHRRSTHWTMLVEHVYSVSQLQGKLRFLELGLSCQSAHERRRLAEHINCLDGEIGLCQDLADRRDLAARINKDANLPLIDGLTLRGLTYVFGEHADVWRDFQSLVEKTVVAANDSSNKKAGI